LKPTLQKSLLPLVEKTKLSATLENYIVALFWEILFPFPRKSTISFDENFKIKKWAQNYHQQGRGMNFEPEKIVEQHFIISIKIIKNHTILSTYQELIRRTKQKKTYISSIIPVLSYTHVFENICDDMITNHISFKTYMN